MISLTRVRTAAAIASQFHGDDLAAASLSLLRDQRAILKGDLEKHDFNSDIWKKAKAQLLDETADKCAYCETPTAVVSYGDVEHYRPKSKYWWLAYCLDNYLVSCAICNRREKKDKFTYKNTKMRPPSVRSNSTDAHLNNASQDMVPDPLDASAVDAFLALHRQEEPFLINPYFDRPEHFFAWRADVNTQEVELVTRPDNLDAEFYVQAAVDIYGLNRKELRSLRYFIFDSYFTHKKTLMDPGISAATRSDNQRTINNMLLPERPFAGMIRFFETAGQPDDWEADGFLVPGPA